MSRFVHRMPSRIAFAAVLIVAAGLAAGCQQSQESATETGAGEASGEAATEQAGAPAEALPAGHIEVQHVLVGFQGSVPGKDIKRTQAEAKKLAYEILDRAKGGEDFDQLVQQYTDDQFPGVYRLADEGVEVEQGVEYPRGGMVKGFGDAAFSLQLGEVGIADYDPQASKYGWHIIKRLR